VPRVGGSTASSASRIESEVWTFHPRALKHSGEPISTGEDGARRSTKPRRGAGAKFSGSNELFIANSQTATPLIFGNFETKAATINGTLEISESPGKPTKPAEGAVEAGPSRMAARKTTFAIVGNGSTGIWTLKHALNTRLVTVTVQKAEGEEPGEIESPGNYKAKPNGAAEVKVTFDTAPAAGAEYFITVIG
jgi:hypothetical protein